MTWPDAFVMLGFFLMVVAICAIVNIGDIARFIEAWKQEEPKP